MHLLVAPNGCASALAKDNLVLVNFSNLRGKLIWRRRGCFEPPLMKKHAKSVSNFGKCE